MGDLPTADDAQLAQHLAEATAREIERRRDAEIKAAADEIRARYALELEAAYAAVRDAQIACVAARDRCEEHPWAGKRVFRMESRGRSWERRPPERVEGVVETFRSASSLPGNVRYGRPLIGDGIVRFLKKDGTPGLKFERLRPHHSWKLVEDARDQ